MRPLALIVDDSEIQRWVVRAALEPDFVVREAEGVAAALAQASRPALACVDWSLLDGNGSELCQALRRRDGACVIVVLTADVDGELRRLAHQAGADAVVEKTGDVAALSRELREAFRRGRAG